MSTKYHFDFSWTSPYGHALKLLSIIDRREGVVLDLGCGRGPIAETVVEKGLDYFGFDVDPGAIEDLRGRGFEATELDLTDTGALVTTLTKVVGERPVAAICMLDVLEHLADPQKVLEAIRDVSVEVGRPPLVLSLPNVSHFDVGAKLLLGRWDVAPTGLLDETHLHFYTEHRLVSQLESLGWVQIAECDFRLHHSDQHEPPYHPALAEGSLLQSFLRRLRARVDSSGDINQFVRAFSCGDVRISPKGAEDEGAPFFSVLLRTRGNRLETLGEALLCLAGQTDPDFETLVLLHSGLPERLEMVRRVVNEFDSDFATRVRVLHVPGGERSRPLNVGLEQARGQYVAFLDDDDLVTGDWVEVFKAGAAEAPGSIVRSVAVDQMIRLNESGLGAPYLPTSGFIVDPLRVRFDHLRHFVANRTPICAFAVPRAAFESLRLRFREDMAVLEDWEFLLQAASMCGVHDTGEVTSIYHRWEEGESAWNTVKDGVWKINREFINARLSGEPLLLPPGSVDEIVELVQASDRAQSLERRVHALGQLETRLSAVTQRLEERDRSLRDAEQKLRDERQLLRDMTKELKGVTKDRALLQRKLDQVWASTSWKFTAPIRRVLDMLRGLQRPVRRR